MLAKTTALKAAHISAWCVLLTSVVLQFVLLAVALADTVAFGPVVIAMLFVAATGWAASVLADATADYVEN